MTVFLAVIALLAWTWHRQSAPGNMTLTVPDSAEQRPAVNPSIDPSAPEVSVPAEGPSRESAPSGDAELAASTLEGILLTAPPAPPPADPWWLRIRVVGDIPSGTTEVLVQPSLDQFGWAIAIQVEAKIGPDGTVTVDLGPSLAKLAGRTKGEVARKVLVRLKNPGLLETPTEHRLPDPLPASIEDPDRAFEIDVTARPAHLIRGRFVHADTGEPIQDGQAAIYALSDGAPARSPIASANVENGTFELRAASAGRVAVLGLQAGMRPSTTIVDLGAATGSSDLGDVAMSAGYKIEGFVEAAMEKRLRGPDAPAAAGEGFNVSVSVTEVVSICEIARGGLPCAALVWRRGAFDWMSWTTKTLPGGRFEITGLAPHEYSVDWSEPGVHRPLPLGNQKLVSAPASVRLTGMAAWVEFQLSWTEDVAVADNPLIGGSYKVSQEGEQREQRFAIVRQQVDGTDQRRGEMVLEIPPRKETTIELIVDGFDAVERTMPPMAPGEASLARVELVAQRSGSVLVFELRGAPVPDGSPLSVLRQGEWSDEFQLAVKDGIATSGPQKPGPATYEIVVGTDRFATAGHFCRAVVEVDVPPDGERRVPVNITIGGTLIVEIKDRAGVRHEGIVELTDIDGNPIPSTWVASFDQGRVASEGAVMGNAPARRASDLPPGTYGIRMISGDRPTERQTFDITAGRTTEVLIEIEDR